MREFRSFQHDCLKLCGFLIACAMLILLYRTMLDRNRKMAQVTELIDTTTVTETLDIAS